MSKSTHFFGQPVYGQLIKRLNKEKILQISRRLGGERYVKSFDGFHPFANDALCGDNAIRFTA